MKTEPFKTCTACGLVWPTLESFLDDPSVRLAGYQAHFEELTGGLFIFTHVHDHCGTSLGIPVSRFTALSDRPILSAKGRRPETCPQLCMREGCFDPCPEKCECSWVREILHKIETWTKKPSSRIPQ